MTPAVNCLRQAKIPFSLHEYVHDPATRAFGREAAEKLGISEDQLFKTLVVSLSDNRVGVGLVPVSGNLDLKAFAKALGVKKAALANPGLAERITGYVKGGISPLGQKKRLPTVIDRSALALDKVFVSAGRRGLQILLSPEDLGRLTRAVFHKISDSF